MDFVETVRSGRDTQIPPVERQPERFACARRLERLAGQLTRCQLPAASCQAFPAQGSTLSSANPHNKDKALGPGP